MTGGKRDGVSTRSQRQVNLDTSLRSSSRRSVGSSALSAATKFKNTHSDSSNLSAYNVLLEKVESLISLMEAVEEKLSNKIDDAFNNINERVDELQRNVDMLQGKIDKIKLENNNLRRMYKLNQVIIRGIPELDNENPKELIQEISSIVGHNISPYVDAFRVRHRKYDNTGNAVDVKNSTKRYHAPLVVNFSCINEKKLFCSLFYKRHGVTLKELKNFSSESKIFVNDNLTSANNRILRAALKLYKRAKLDQVYTSNGFVYVKMKNNSKHVKVTCIDQLSEFLNDNMNNVGNPAT